MTDLDVAIVGAGPYGLSAAAHLPQTGVRVFGRPMSFWREHMPEGMMLRSPRGASDLVAPGARLSLGEYEREHGLAPASPVPLSTFLDYGEWFARRALDEIDPRTVERIERRNGAFALTLSDGQEATSRAVVVAAGIDRFASRPPEFAALSDERTLHSVAMDVPSRFADRRVIVIGAGQSAIESAALLHEAGAAVSVVARATRINWLTRSGKLHRLKPLRRLLYAPSDIGPAGVSWLIHEPDLLRLIPRPQRDRLAARSIRPAASAWLVPRLDDIPLRLGRRVVSADDGDETVSLSLDDGTRLVADLVLLATGYRVDLDHYEFLAGELLAEIARADGYPQLTRGFESSVSNLFFLGAPAAWSHGPLFRFVAGARYASPAVTRALSALRPAGPRGGGFVPVGDAGGS